MDDQQRTTVVGILVLLAVFGAGLLVAGGLLLEGRVPLLPREGRVAIVPIHGIIDSEREVLRSLERFREDESVGAFVVEIRSPGGTVGGSQSLYREIRSLRDEDDRPVLAWIGDVGASGGYYAALGADSIYALPGSITGSIGVIMELPNARRLLRKAGVEVEVVKSGPHKDAGSLLRPLSEEDRAVLQTLVDDAYRQFVEAVSESRGFEGERARELADGRVYSGERARRLGLVDGLATLSETVDRAGRMTGLGEDPATVRPKKERPGLIDLLLEGISARWLEGWLDLPSLPRSADGSTPRLLYQWR